MESLEALVERTGAPSGDSHEFLDARELPPPKPLQDTLERLEAIADGTVLIQLNDRAPQFLYPKLEDRGYAYETVEESDGMVTVIWKA